MMQQRRLLLFVVGIVAVFVWICHLIPQVQVAAIVEVTEVGETPLELVEAGRRLFASDTAQCLTCHSLGPDPNARCPNQDGLGERAGQRRPGSSAAEYIMESLYDPNAFIVPGYPRNQMTPANQPPIALSHDQILALGVYLNSLGGMSDEAFVASARRAQEPWRRGLRQPDEADERATLPVFEGDREAGREVFLGQGCTRCHRIQGEGADLCPDLTLIGASQGPQYILESVLDPGAVIVKGYKQTVVMWAPRGRAPLRGLAKAWIPNHDAPEQLVLAVEEPDGLVEVVVDLGESSCVGDTVVGTKQEGVFQRYCGELLGGDETTGIRLAVLEDGRWSERVLAAEVIQFVNAPASSMPTNFQDLLTPRQTYDLLAFLLAAGGDE